MPWYTPLYSYLTCLGTHHYTPFMVGTHYTTYLGTHHCTLNYLVHTTNFLVHTTTFLVHTTTHFLYLDTHHKPLFAPLYTLYALGQTITHLIAMHCDAPLHTLYASVHTTTPLICLRTHCYTHYMAWLYCATLSYLCATTP